jgi:hypothetical protein
MCVHYAYVVRKATRYMMIWEYRATNGKAIEDQDEESKMTVHIYTGSVR